MAAYATASRGYRYGGINTIGSLPYSSDSLWNYETGLRLQPAGEVSLDLSLFMLDWKNIQMQTTNADGFVIITNAAKARSNGFEAALAWRPTQAFSLNGSLALTDAKLRASFDSASGRAVESCTTLPGVAKVQSTLDATYICRSVPDQRVGVRRAAVRGQAQRADRRRPGLPAYTTADLRMAFGWSNWELTGYVQNVADQRGQSSAAGQLLQLPEPGRGQLHRVVPDQAAHHRRQPAL